MVLRSYSVHRFRMASRRGDVSTSVAGKGKKSEPSNDIVFSKEQFNAKFCFPLPSLFKQFLHFTKVSPTFLHLNVVRILMGCSVLNMLYHLDIFLLEVLFIYTIKMSGKEIFNLSAHIPSLQLVIELPDSTKGATKGIVVDVYYLVYYRKEKEMLVDSQPYVVFSLPHFASRMLVLDKHYVVKDLSFYLKVRTVDAKARQDWLAKRENKCGSRSTSSSTTHPPSKKKSVGPNHDSTGLPSLEGHSDQEPKPMVPCINLEPKEEEENTCLVGDEASATTSSGNVMEKDALDIPSKFFSFSHRHFVNLGSNSRMASVVRPSHVTLNFVLRCTYPLLKYTAKDMAEVKALKELQEGMQAEKAKARRMGEEKEVVEAKCKVGFTVDKEALTRDYQKQVDEMFFYGYQCCMRKNAITQDIPTYSFDDEKNDLDSPSPSTGQ
ncbi:hypothetical protein AAG906_026781 [Vitis piasezkii]